MKFVCCNMHDFHYIYARFKGINDKPIMKCNNEEEVKIITEFLNEIILDSKKAMELIKKIKS
jgi:hypothetical protein